MTTPMRKGLLCILLLVGLSGQAVADEAKAFVTALTLELEAALNDAREKGMLEDQQYLDGLIDRHILPYVDHTTLSKQIFRPRWDEIVAQGKAEEASEAVIASLKRTYRLALTAYNGQRIEISDSIDKGRYHLVRTRVHTRENGHTIDLALRQIDGEWRIFDLSVDGVVVTKTLNGSIQRLLTEEDIDAVIQAVDPQSASSQD